MKIYIDADAFPNLLKNILFKTVKRRNIELILVANQHVKIPDSNLISFILVTDGADVADDKIVELSKKDDLVVSADIPLADRVIEKGAFVLTPRGEMLTEENIKPKLATRDLMYDLRITGENLGGPPAFTQKDSHNFANALDKLLTKYMKS